MYGAWGGPPYEDLVSCVEYLATIPYIDMDRAVVAGASYGGYMVNYILGKPLAQKVCTSTGINTGKGREGSLLNLTERRTWSHI